MLEIIIIQLSENRTLQDTIWRRVCCLTKKSQESHGRKETQSQPVWLEAAVLGGKLSPL